MDKVTFDSVVGFVLALAFAIVMGICMKAVLVGDYMQPGSVMNQQTQHTLRSSAMPAASPRSPPGGCSNSPPDAA